MKVKANKKQEVIITLTDNEASTLADILEDTFYACTETMEDKVFMKEVNKPRFSDLRNALFDKHDMSDLLYDMIRYAQGYYVDREGFDE